MTQFSAKNRGTRYVESVRQQKKWKKKLSTNANKDWNEFAWNTLKTTLEHIQFCPTSMQSYYDAPKQVKKAKTWWESNFTSIGQNDEQKRMLCSIYLSFTHTHTHTNKIPQDDDVLMKKICVFYGWFMFPSTVAAATAATPSIHAIITIVSFYTLQNILVYKGN